MCDVCWAFLWPPKNFVVLLITMFGSIKFLSLLCFLLVSVGSCAEQTNRNSAFSPLVTIAYSYRMKWRKKMFENSSSFAVARRKSFAVLCCDSTLYHVLLGSVHSLHTADVAGVVSMMCVFHLPRNVAHAERDNFVTRCTYVMASMCSLLFSVYGNNESTGKALPPREFLYHFGRNSSG